MILMTLAPRLRAASQTKILPKTSDSAETADKMAPGNLYRADHGVRKEKRKKKSR
jgi:hypothetical protein